MASETIRNLDEFERKYLPRKYEEDHCEECAALRKGWTWVFDPPKCEKHMKKMKW